METWPKSYSVHRLRQVLTEIARTPHTAALAAGGFAALVARRRSSGRLAGAAAAYAWILAEQGARVERTIRSAEDAAILAARLGRFAPLFGRWVVEADFAGLIARELESASPELVVECGSGATTLVIAAQLAANGRGRLVSLEHDTEFAAVTRARLEASGLADRATVIHAPLEDRLLNGRRARWYDGGAVAAAVDAAVDVLVVDGPPQRERWARWPAVILLHDQLAADAVVYMDDGRTRHTREAAEAWINAYPDLELYWIDTVKGTWLLRRTSRRRSSALNRVLAARRALNPRPVGGGRWPIRR